MIHMAVVIIPTFRPDKTLISITDQLWSLGYGIIVVDDGSGKDYRQIFEAVSDISIVLHHSENQGKGAAIKTALNYIKNEMWDSDVIGVMDSDGQHQTEDMRRVLEFADNHRKTLVLGVRNVGKEMPLKSRIGNRITRTVFRMISGVKVSDTQTGLRAFSSDLIKKLLSVQGERYEYEMNVLIELAKAKIPIEEVPIDTIYHDKNNSCSHFHVFRDSIRIYKNLLKFTLSSFSSFIVDYVLFALLLIVLPHTALWVFLANVCARVVSAFYNYTLNCSLVFHTGRKIRTAAEYFVLAAFILVMNSLILSVLVQLLHFSVYPAKILTESILFFVSWVVQRRLIFKKRLRLENKEEYIEIPILCPAHGKVGVL